MNNFEVIDDYLANRLQGTEREEFETQLGNDPVLKSELELQRQIIEGIKQARSAELKAMLSKVPVAGGGATIEFSVLRIAAGVLLAGVISAATYYYLKSHGFPPIENAAADVGGKDVKPKDTKPAETATPQPDGKQENATPDQQTKSATKKDAPEVKPVEKPALDLVDPSAELSEGNKSLADQSADARPEITGSHIQVDMDSSNKKYNFHYQFVEQKLMLYGSFDRSLFEVLEVNGGDHALFLYYKNNFYVLDETKLEITKLSPIQDQTLLKRLREYRSR